MCRWLRRSCGVARSLVIIIVAMAWLAGAGCRGPEPAIVVEIARTHSEARGRYGFGGVLVFDLTADPARVTVLGPVAAGEDKPAHASASTDDARAEADGQVAVARVDPDDARATPAAIELVPVPQSSVSAHAAGGASEARAGDGRREARASAESVATRASPSDRAFVPAPESSDAARAADSASDALARAMARDARARGDAQEALGIGDASEARAARQAGAARSRPVDIAVVPGAGTSDAASASDAASHVQARRDEDAALAAAGSDAARARGDAVATIGVPEARSAAATSESDAAVARPASTSLRSVEGTAALVSVRSDELVRSVTGLESVQARSAAGALRSVDSSELTRSSVSSSARRTELETLEAAASVPSMASVASMRHALGRPELKHEADRERVLADERFHLVIELANGASLPLETAVLYSIPDRRLVPDVGDVRAEPGIAFRAAIEGEAVRIEVLDRVEVGATVRFHVPVRFPLP